MAANVSKRERVQQDRINDLSLRDSDIAVAADAGTTVDVVIQLHDRYGRVLQEQGAVEVWLSDAARGAVVAVAPSGGWALLASSVLLNSFVANKYALWLSHTDGKVSIRITEAGAKTLYINVRHPGDFRIASALVTFV
jgi:hypothetical protein